MIDRRPGEAGVGGHAVVAAREQITASGADRIEVHHCQMLLEQRHPQIVGVDTRPTRVNDTYRATTDDLVRLANTFGFEFVPAGYKAEGSTAGHVTSHRMSYEDL